MEVETQFEPRKYACVRWPFLRLGSGLKFQNGFLTATTQAAADRIENHPAYGIQVHPVKIDVAKVIAEREEKKNHRPIEAMIEEEIQAALAANQPRA
ncbi:MAG: hypothetical protein ACREA9_24660, partial [Pyrinomonadaceae bacterium]